MYDIVFASKHDRNRTAFERFSMSYPGAKWLPNVKSLSKAVAAASPMVNTSMYWLITDDVQLDSNFDLTWKAETWDRPYPHVWPTVDSNGNPSSEFAGAYLIPKRYKPSTDELENGFLKSSKEMPGPTQLLLPFDIYWAKNDADITRACLSARSACVTEMHWIVMDDVDVSPDMDFNWRPPTWDRTYAHVCAAADASGKILEHNTGVYLIPGDYQTTSDEQQQGSLHSLKLLDTVASVVKPYDIFFISYREPDAADNYQLLLDRFPRAQHVSGIKGIHNAHMRCAELSNTKMFWTVDADTIVDSGFAFDYRPPDYDQQYLHLWHSRNPVNGLSYGWGAIKLWPTKLVRDFRSNWLDFTTTVGNIKIVSDVIATTKYNCDAMSTWRSGFREAVKLCHNISNGDHIESLERLMVWLTIENPVPWANDSTQGARSGVDFYLKCRRESNTEALGNINDFDWLIDRFNARKVDMPLPARTDLLSALRY